MTAHRTENATRPRHAPRIAPRQRARLLLVLAGLSAASPLATDMYVPGLPDLARSLGADASGAQMSLTGFLAGIIAGQLALGPLSDAVGRRPVLVSGTALFTLFSVVCALAPTLAVLNAARVGQGFSGAAGIVIARAVVTDLFDDGELATVYSRLGALSATAPVLAPLAGGAVLLVVSWRYVFAALALIGLLLILGVLRWVPESHPPQARLTGGLAGSLRTIGQVAAQRAVIAPVLTLAFGGAAVFAYIAGRRPVPPRSGRIPAGRAVRHPQPRTDGSSHGRLPRPGHPRRHRHPADPTILNRADRARRVIALRPAVARRRRLRRTGRRLLSAPHPSGIGTTVRDRYRDPATPCPGALKQLGTAMPAVVRFGDGRRLRA